jgi:hypothetical protein
MIRLLLEHKYSLGLLSKGFLRYNLLETMNTNGIEHFLIGTHPNYYKTMHMVDSRERYTIVLHRPPLHNLE